MSRGSFNIAAGGAPAAALALASQAEAVAGTNNTKAMTPLRVAEAISALGGDGGGGAVALDLDGLAWVNSETGSDATGDGSPQAPFATAQAAYDEGFRRLMILGAGGPLSISQSVWLHGLGWTLSRVAGITAPHGGITVTGNGRECMLVSGSIDFLGTSAAEGSNGHGDSLAACEVRGLRVGGTISMIAGSGGPGAPAPDEGGDGEHGGSGGNVERLTIEDCHVTGGCYAAGGNGGNGGSGGNGVDGGNGGNGGNGGSGGSGGEVGLIDSICLGVVESHQGIGTSGGIGGAGDGGGEGGYSGEQGGNGEGGVVSLLNSRVGDTPDPYAVTCLCSVVAGVFYANSYP